MEILRSTRQFQKLALSAELDTGSLGSLTELLEKALSGISGREQTSSTLVKRVGRIGPIVDSCRHRDLLGSIWEWLAFLGQKWFLVENFQVTNIVNLDRGLRPPSWSLRVNRFWIDYTPAGGIDQFYSDISVLDKQEKEVKRKTILLTSLCVTDVTFYQKLIELQRFVQMNKSPVLQLPMARLNKRSRSDLGTWIPTKPDLSAGVSLARDLGNAAAYDAKVSWLIRFALECLKN